MNDHQKRKLLNGFINPMADMVTAIKLYQLGIIVLGIIALIEGICLYKALSRQQLIVQVDPKGQVIPLEIQEGHPENYINYQQFLKDYLYRIYCWNKDSYKSQVSSALPLMEGNLQRQFIQEIKEKQIYDTVVANEVTSVLTNIRFDRESIEPLDVGWRIKAEAIKLRMPGPKQRAMPVRYTISFKTCPLSEDNIYGFMVFELIEDEIMS